MKDLRTVLMITLVNQKKANINFSKANTKLD